MSVDQQQAPAPPEPEMVERATGVDWAPVPRVNLLPPEVLERRRFRAVKWRLAFAFALVIAHVAGATVWSQLQVRQARSDLAGTRARTTELHQQEGEYVQVPFTLAAVQSAEVARATAMGTDVLWYRFLNDVALAMPATVSLNTMKVSLAAEGSTTGTLGATGIGTVEIAGTAGSYPAVASWMDSISGVNGMQAVTLRSATREATTAGEDPTVTFTAQLLVTEAALSHRYDKKAG
jgi:Tfp pilus assembly protein PilN